jgi:hypothetical protein
MHTSLVEGVCNRREVNVFCRIEGCHFQSYRWRKAKKSEPYSTAILHKLAMVVVKTSTMAAPQPIFSNTSFKHIIKIEVCAVSSRININLSSTYKREKGGLLEANSTSSKVQLHSLNPKTQ